MSFYLRWEHFLNLPFLMIVLGLTFWKKAIIVVKFCFDYFEDRLKCLVLYSWNKNFRLWIIIWLFLWGFVFVLFFGGGGGSNWAVWCVTMWIYEYCQWFWSKQRGINCSSFSILYHRIALETFEGFFFNVLISLRLVTD